MWALAGRFRKRFPSIASSQYFPKRYSIVSTQVFLFSLVWDASFVRPLRAAQPLWPAHLIHSDTMYIRWPGHLPAPMPLRRGSSLPSGRTRMRTQLMCRLHVVGD